MKCCALILPLAVATLFFSCGTPLNTDEETTADSMLPDPAAVPAENHFYDYSHTVLKEAIADTAYALFSSDTEEDCFTLFVPAGLISETQTTLRITSGSGEVAYEHLFPTRDLVNGYATAYIRNETEMQEHVLSEAASILQGLEKVNSLPPDSYLNRALPEDFERYDVYTALKKTERVLFHYCLNEESHYYLGYSDAEKKVVKLIYCC